MKTDTFKDLTVKKANEKLKALSPELIDMTLTFVPKGNLTLNVRGMPLVYNVAKQQFEFRNVQWEKMRQAELDRRKITAKPNGLRIVPASIINGKVILRVLVDRASLELFVNNGAIAATFQYVPDAANRSISIEAGSEQHIESVVVNELRSAWKN